MNNITSEILEHIGVIGEKSNGWKREVNIVSWNGGQPKVDIREWDEHHERMSKGITLTDDEVEVLIKTLNEWKGVNK